MVRGHVNAPYFAVPPAVILGLNHHIRPQSQPRVTVAHVPLHALLPNIPATQLWPLPDPMMYREPQPCWSCRTESPLTEDLEGDRQGGHEERTRKAYPATASKDMCRGHTGRKCVEHHLLQHSQTCRRICREDIWGVPQDSIQVHVGKTWGALHATAPTDSPGGRAGSETMRGGHAGRTTHKPEERDLCQRQLHPGFPRARITAEDVQDYSESVEHAQAPRCLQLLLRRRGSRGDQSGGHMVSWVT